MAKIHQCIVSLVVICTTWYQIMWTKNTNRFLKQTNWWQYDSLCDPCFKLWEEKDSGMSMRGKQQNTDCRTLLLSSTILRTETHWLVELLNATATTALLTGAWYWWTTYCITTLPTMYVDPLHWYIGVLYWCTAFGQELPVEEEKLQRTMLDLVHFSLVQKKNWCIHRWAKL